MTEEKCSCGCGCGDECDCGCCDCCCDCDCDKEIAFELCRTLIEGRTYTAEGVAEAFKTIFNAVKSCKSDD